MKNLTIDEIKNMSQKDLAFLILKDSKKSINTLDLFKMICNKLELPDSDVDRLIGDFYTSMTTDKRFVIVDGKWDLRDNHTSDKVIVKTDDTEEDEEEIEEDSDYEEEEEDSFDKDNDDDDYTDDDSDNLGDLVIIDEDELDDNN